jgi:hypothetical protein
MVSLNLQNFALLFYLQLVIYFRIDTVPCLEIKKLGGSPVTEGGEDLDLNFIATIGYPEPLKTKDIQKIIDNAPFVEKMLAAGNKKSYMAQMGYLERQGFNDCFTGNSTFCIQHTVLYTRSEQTLFETAVQFCNSSHCVLLTVVYGVLMRMTQH